MNYNGKFVRSLSVLRQEVTSVFCDVTTYPRFHPQLYLVSYSNKLLRRVGRGGVGVKLCDMAERKMKTVFDLLGLKNIGSTR